MKKLLIAFLAIYIVSLLAGVIILSIMVTNLAFDHKMVCEEVVKESEVTSDGVKIKKSNVRIHCEEFLGVEK